MAYRIDSEVTAARLRIPGEFPTGTYQYNNLPLFMDLSVRYRVLAARCAHLDVERANRRLADRVHEAIRAIDRRNGTPAQRRNRVLLALCARRSDASTSPRP
jgi:hypothetical protein